MHQSIVEIGNLYKMNTGLFWHVIKDVSAEHLLTRPMESGNSIRYILGHVTSSRFLVTRLLGAEIENPWGDLFSRGKEIQDDSLYPSVDEIMRHWDAVSEKLMDAMGNASEEHLTASSELGTPGEATIIGNVSFLSLHESNHLGQIVYVRRLLGYSRSFG